MEYIAFFFFFYFLMVLRPIEVTNLFPDLPKYYFGSEDAIFILSRLPKSK